MCIQLWSLQGLTPERKAQYDAILEAPLEHFNGEQAREKVEKKSGEIVPWESQLETIEFLKAEAARLRTFCTSTIRTARVRSILKEAKVIGNVPRHHGRHTNIAIKRATRKLKRMAKEQARKAETST